MNNKALYLAQLHKEIELIPEDKLREAVDFIDFLRRPPARPSRRIARLRGIWAGKGFEKLAALETDLRVMRAEVEAEITRKAG